ncbi:MAG: nitroreductase family protein [Theionarchaea archaeon]|nr:nitroreductase family protein [Theionarchaea archaeon]MBU7000410.1 nitroreductase family protein [Theionarchaea archaeon]MBU7021252.1 nitroreductase family protein [Theionarchaea archaeon]MBU7035305.1 nitroreductase family protein [Theionarchaea archaeon]MBU7039744.1 nitroreductase family protein [Theionarchaea archaeon]
MDLQVVIRERRSIRRFKSDPVPRKDIEKMIHAASLAPSGGNLQPWRFIAITNKGYRDEMRRIIHDEGVAFFNHTDNKSAARRIASSLVFSTAPLVFAVLVMPFSLERDPNFRIFQEERALRDRAIDRYGGFVSVQSVGAAVQNLLLTALDCGYGSCWVRIPYYAHDELERLLNIHEPWEILALVPVGIPDHNPDSPPRKSVQQILTYIE